MPTVYQLQAATPLAAEFRSNTIHMSMAMFLNMLSKKEFCSDSALVEDGSFNLLDKMAKNKAVVSQVIVYLFIFKVSYLT